MAFSAITGDICTQETHGAFNCIASGTILAGQAVEVVAGNYVVASDSNPALGFFGVADMGKTKGQSINVWGPGSIIWTRASGTGVTAGAPVVAVVDGLFRAYASTDLPPSGAVGVSLTTQGTTLGLIQVKLY